MSDLNERLNSALAAVDPGPAPVEAAVHDGRKIRTRRRAGVLAGAVAVVAAAVVAVPALTHQQALPAPTISQVRVTVNPPGPHSPAGLIASGMVGPDSWQWIIGKPGTDGAPRGQQCFHAGGTLFSQFGLVCDGSAGLDENGQGHINPVTFEGEGDEDGDTMVWGVVADPAVSYVTIGLGGKVLTLHPAMVYGARYVAFAVPPHMVVGSATAYSRTGEIATAIPYDAPSGFPTFEAWLRPGQAVPGRVSGAFGSGTVNGHAWRATAYLGPWGTCLEADSGGACFDPSPHPTTGDISGAASGVFGMAADSVSYLVITLKDGSAIRVGVTAVGPEKFWGVGLSQKAQTGARWTAYDARGKPVASGSII